MNIISSHAILELCFNPITVVNSRINLTTNYVQSVYSINYFLLVGTLPGLPEGLSLPGDIRM
jgi:hypothetical protein